MPQVSPQAQHIAKAIRARNRALRRPLSLLHVNALDFRGLLAWEPWLRRVVVFNGEEETHYRLVAVAMGLDFYTRFNFRLAPVGWDAVSTQAVAWPFDVVYVCLSTEVWESGLALPQGWGNLLSAQAAVGDEFLLVVEGPQSLVDAVEGVAQKAGPTRSGPLALEAVAGCPSPGRDADATLRVWRASHPTAHTCRTWSSDELAAVSDLMQWGEESSR